MEKIPTAEEFLQNYKNDTDHYADQDYSEGRLIKALQEFAKIHVTKALKYALEEVPYGGSDAIHYEDVVGILTCYPIENIK